MILSPFKANARIRQLEAQLREADRLAQTMDTPNQACAEKYRYEYDWHRIDEALDAWRAVRGE